MKLRAKLYRFREDMFKERGTGNIKMMRHKETKKVRVIMRQEKTLKPVANFISKYQVGLICAASSGLSPVFARDNEWKR